MRVNVSARLTSYAMKVLRDGCEELVEAMGNGKLAVSAAAGLPEAEQRRLVEAGPKEALRKVRELRGGREGAGAGEIRGGRGKAGDAAEQHGGGDAAVGGDGGDRDRGESAQGAWVSVRAGRIGGAVVACVNGLGRLAAGGFSGSLPRAS